MNTQTLISKNGIGEKYLQRKTNVLSRKSNILNCRCCGKSYYDNLTVHHIVPRIIGGAFPHEEFLKCPTILLCHKCHDKYERTADIIKFEYAQDLNIDLNLVKKIPNPSYEINRLLVKSAKSLLQVTDDWSSTVTADKKVNTILNYLESAYYTRNDLIKIISSHENKYIRNPEYINLGEALIEYFSIDIIKRFWINHWNSFELKYKHSLKIKNKFYKLKNAA